MKGISFFSTQKKCQYILENILNTEFSTSRHDLGNYSEGCNLELDGFNRRLRIAFEYQGEQHDNYIPRFHRSYQDFLKTKAKDTYKIKICKDKKIKLVSISSNDAKSDTELITNIIKKLEMLGVDKELINYNVSLDGYYAHEYPPLYKFEDIVKRNGGKIICITSDEYNHHCAKVECELGHIFLTRVGAVERKYSWCRECANIYPGKIPHALQHYMRLMAKERGGNCKIIEEEYYDYKSGTNKVSHEAFFTCNKNHSPFQLSKTDFFEGQWCPKCFNPILEIIKSKGGRCTEYTLFKPSGISIKCSERKHYPFNLSEEEILSGKWCPNCGN